MGRIVDIRTENISELKTLFETLKDVLNETVITILKSKNNKHSENLSSRKIEDNLSDDESHKHSKSKKDKKDKKDKKLKNKSSEKESKKAKSKKKLSSTESDISEDEQQQKEINDSDDGDDDNSSKEVSKAKAEEDDEEGIRIFNIDENQTLLIFVKLSADQFLKFDCKYPEYKIGVELTPLFKQFKIMDKEGMLTMYIDDDDKQHLNLDVANDDAKCSTNYQVKLLDLNARKWKLPPSKFTIVVTMDCSEFHKICRDMHSVNCEFMEITCTDKKITFSCVGDSTKINRTYDNGGSGVKIKCPKRKKDKIVIVNNIYELKYLTMFNKCSNICSEIQIFLKDEYPMFMRYSIATLGSMLVGLSPVVEKSLSKNNNYDPANDVHYPRSDIHMKNEL
jgi:proliferating cell nuclear antigen